VRLLLWLFIVSLFFPCVSLYSQSEQITITTYYPSPFGVYNELDIHDNLSFKFDDTGVIVELDLSIDSDANLHLDDRGTSPDGFHIIFDDVNRPFAYLQEYTSTGGMTWCADNYVAANFLTQTKIPADPTSLPADGYMVCIRGWEEF
jgi:hypothetical protein